MNPSEANLNLRYITNSSGDTTDVIVPIKLWEKLVHTLETESGLQWIDEHESCQQILADLQESLQQALTEQTYPIEQLWTENNK
ncbi:MAG: hypothetical protein EA365_12640 [Gloeocapsa sp. DLM2.Bin57]|nr:MAG: hypothetical protein EA365_12640 [Gloeocapsa sp. DLM2.Bin57]